MPTAKQIDFIIGAIDWWCCHWRSISLHCTMKLRTKDAAAAILIAGIKKGSTISDKVVDEIANLFPDEPKSGWNGSLFWSWLVTSYWREWHAVQWWTKTSLVLVSSLDAHANNLIFLAPRVLLDIRWQIDNFLHVNACVYSAWRPPCFEKQKLKSWRYIPRRLE